MKIANRDGVSDSIGKVLWYSSVIIRPLNKHLINMPRGNMLNEVLHPQKSKTLRSTPAIQRVLSTH